MSQRAFHSLAHLTNALLPRYDGKANIPGQRGPAVANTREDRTRQGRVEWTGSGRNRWMGRHGVMIEVRDGGETEGEEYGTWNSWMG